MSRTPTHIQIHMGRDKAQVLVDGFDLTPHVLAEGVRVDVGDRIDQPSVVHLRLAADVLDIDLPEGILASVLHDDAEPTTFEEVLEAQFAEQARSRRMLEEIKRRLDALTSRNGVSK